MLYLGLGKDVEVARVLELVDAVLPPLNQYFLERLPVRVAHPPVGTQKGARVADNKSGETINRRFIIVLLYTRARVSPTKLEMLLQRSRRKSSAARPCSAGITQDHPGAPPPQCQDHAASYLTSCFFFRGEAGGVVSDVFDFLGLEMLIASKSLSSSLSNTSTSLCV